MKGSSGSCSVLLQTGGVPVQTALPCVQVCPAPDLWCPCADSIAMGADQAPVAAFSDGVYAKAFSCIRSTLEIHGLFGRGDSSWCPCDPGFAVTYSVVSLRRTGSRDGIECFCEQNVLQACPGLHRVLPCKGCVKAALFFRCHSTFSGGRRP